MDLIGGINLYTLKGAQMRKSLKEETTGVQEQTKTFNTEKKCELAADDVLKYMANQSVSMQIDVKQTLKTERIVDKDPYSKIADMMKDFEEQVESGMKLLNGEFPNLKISEDSKLKLVLSSMERRRTDM